MAIKLNPNTGKYDVAYYKRHPITRMPVRASRTGIKTEAQARRALNELVIQVEDKIRGKTVPTWKEVVESQYQRNLTEKTKKTANNYIKCVSHHTIEKWGERLIDSITTDEIRTLIKEGTDELSVNYQKNVLHYIKATFAHAVEKGFLIRNPAPEMKFRKGDKIKVCLTEEQVRTLLNKAKEYQWDWYPHIAIALYTGCRNGELYAMTWDKVNLENRTILIDSSWNNIDGFKSTKSGDDRIVEIAPPLLALLKELKMQSHDRVFVLPRVKGWEQGRQAEHLKMFLVGLGLPQIRFHDLRATWATIMLGKGVEPAKVMFMGGWKNLKTLMIYLRKSGISIKGITDSLNLHNPSTEGAKVLNLSKTGGV